MCKIQTYVKTCEWKSTWGLGRKWAVNEQENEFYLWKPEAQLKSSNWTPLSLRHTHTHPNPLSIALPLSISPNPSKSQAYRLPTTQWRIGCFAYCHWSWFGRQTPSNWSPRVTCESCKQLIKGGFVLWKSDSCRLPWERLISLVRVKNWWDLWLILQILSRHSVVFCNLRVVMCVCLLEFVLACVSQL